MINLVHDPSVPDYQITQKNYEKLKDIYLLDEAHILHGPNRVNIDLSHFQEFSTSYINYYVCNGSIILPAFADNHRDGEAKEKLQQHYPEKEVVQINIDAIAIGGGGIHCLTQQEYAHKI